MSIDINLQDITVTEFGFGIDDEDRTYVMVPVDGQVQEALLDMANNTVRILRGMIDTPASYQPSEKYGATEYVTIPIVDGLAQSIRSLHNAENIVEDTSAIEKVDECFAYFARFSDSDGKHLTAVRRASQFKGILKKRLLSFGGDTLKIVPDKIFKLDNDFDFLVDDATVHILRPSAFEFTAQLQGAIMDAVETNIKEISTEIKYIEFDSISKYAQKHPRAARYLASIRSQAEAKRIDRKKLRSYCKKTGVPVKLANGKLHIEDENVMDFLKVLDRRLYEVDLREDGPEYYSAASRQKITRN